MALTRSTKTVSEKETKKTAPHPVDHLIAYLKENREELGAFVFGCVAKPGKKIRNDTDPNAPSEGEVPLVDNNVISSDMVFVADDAWRNKTPLTKGIAVNVHNVMCAPKMGLFG